MVQLIDAPAHSVTSFDVFRYTNGTPKERQREIDKLVENAATLGASGLHDDNRILDPKLVKDALLATELMFGKIPLEALLPFKYDDATADAGIFPPGSESYQLGSPDQLKIFFRYALRGVDRAAPHKFFPDRATLDAHLEPDEAEFVHWFGGAPLRALHAQYRDLITVPLNALAEGYLGLGPGWWNGIEVVGDHGYRRIGGLTLQLIRYLKGDNPKPEDTIFGLHTDSSPGTCVIPEETFDKNAGPDEHRLTIITHDGEHLRPIPEKGDYVFQFGEAFTFIMRLLAHEGKIDPSKIIKPTFHYGLRGPNPDRFRKCLIGFAGPDYHMPIRIDGTTFLEHLTEDISQYFEKE